MSLHLPKVTRRQVLYATTAILMTGMTVTLVKFTQAHGPKQTAAAATAASAGQGDTENSQAVDASAATSASEQQARPKVQLYQVVEGDTIEGIAAKFGLKTESILWTNDLGADDILSIGQQIKIPAVDGLVYTVQSGDTLYDIAANAGVDYDTIVMANPDISPEMLQPDQVILIPGGHPPERRMVASRSSATASRPAPRPSRPTNHFSRWPVSGSISDVFGWRIHPVYGTRHFHDGMDISAPYGSPIRATASGTVTMAERYGGYGLVVRVNHGGGLSTEYAHMSQFAVGVGDEVSEGQIIGYVGTTGASTGPHLHFMVLVGGSPTDPAGWLP